MTALHHIAWACAPLAQRAPWLTRCRMQTLAVGASLGSGGPRARKLQRLKSSFRSSSNISRLSTVQLIQQIQVILKKRFVISHCDDCEGAGRLCHGACP